MPTTPTTEKIDVPLMLWRINPAAAYHWKGNGYGTYDDIGDWRSPDIPQPTEAEVYAEWDKYLKEQSTKAEKRITIEKIEAAETVDDLKALLVQLYQEVKHLL